MFELSVKFNGLKNLFNRNSKATTNAIANVQKSGYTQGYINQTYTSLTGLGDFFDISGTSNIIKACNECPQVSTILFKRAANHANGITTLKTLDDKPFVGSKAAEWQRVIDTPNAFQNRAQYLMTMDIFLGSFGWCFEYKETPFAFGAERMRRRLLDPQFCEITWKKQSLFGIAERNEMIATFHYTENGVRTEIKDIENLYCYVNPNVFEKDKGFLPVSPLKTLKYPINNSIVNYKTRNRLIKKPFGALVGKGKDDVSSIPLNEDEIAELQRAYREDYGTEHDHQNDMMISPTELSFVPFMPPIADLQLLEMLKSDTAVICDRMGYEYDLLARDLGGVALNNKNEAGKNQYQNFEMPHAKNIDQQEMESLNAASNGFKIVTTFDHLPIMQEDKKANSETLRNNVQSLVVAFKNNQCTYDDMIMTIGVSEPPKQWSGKYWYELTDADKLLFDNSHNTNNNGSPSKDTNNNGN